MVKWVWQLVVMLWLFSSTMMLHAQDNRGYIAYVAPGDTANDIYVLDLNSGRARNLTNNPLTSAHPTWSNNGNQMAYVNVIDNNAEIFVMDANGLDQRNISNHPATDVSPDWSPVSDEIVFVSDRDGDFDLYILSISSSSMRQLTHDGADKNRPDWSPDGTQVAYWQIDGANVVLNIVDVATGEVTTLVAEGENLWPAWSPDGLFIAVHSQETGTAQIMIVAVATGERTQITTGAFNNFRPEWSPDGSQIVFVSDQNGSNDLYVVDADGSNMRPLIESDDNTISPAWRSGESAIDFAANPQLGQGAVKVEQGNITEDDQGIIGDGVFRLFAPKQVGIKEVIRIRLEVELPDTANVPEIENIPIRTEGDITLYRYMGAEISGRDMEFFDIHPNPAGYLLQIEEDEVNYWDWFLIPKGDISLGERFFVVELYLPDIADDQIITREVVETIVFDINVLDEAPPFVPDPTPTEIPIASSRVSVIYDQSLRQESVVPIEPVEGFSVYLNSEELLAITFARDVDVSDMSIAAGTVDIAILQTFPEIEVAYDNIAPENLCIFYERDGSEAILPFACQTENRLGLPLNPGDVFWYSALAHSLADIVIRKDGKTYVCSPTFPRCDF